MESSNFFNLSLSFRGYYEKVSSNKLRIVDRVSAFWLGRVAFVPDGRSKPRADSGPNRPPASGRQTSGGQAAFQTPCIALDLTVQFKLYAGIRART